MKSIMMLVNGAMDDLRKTGIELPDQNSNLIGCPTYEVVSSYSRSKAEIRR
jgi:hypothetical protein